MITIYDIIILSFFILKKVEGLETLNPSSEFKLFKFFERIVGRRFSS